MSIDYLPWNQPTSAVARVCMRDGEAELTYAEVATRVDAVAEQFAAMGVGRGDGVSRSAVALKLPSPARRLVGCRGAWRCGCRRRRATQASR
jgi:long-chain acyl-CoA synthetase